MDEIETQVKKTQVVSTPTHEVITTKKVIKDPSIKTEHPQKVFEKKKSIFRTYQVVWYILGVIETILAFRFLLKVLAADPTRGFGFFIYRISDPFAGPFTTVIGIGENPTSGPYIEWSTLLAMLFYLIIAYGIVALLQFVKPVTPKEVEQHVDDNV
jgi:uncharacterized protein YggT (Ycf19 family)